MVDIVYVLSSTFLNLSLMLLYNNNWHSQCENTSAAR